jgi:hypothetical protein
MDVRRLVSFPAIEMKPIRPDAHHGRHAGFLGNSLALSILKPRLLMSPSSEYDISYAHGRF